MILLPDEGRACVEARTPSLSFHDPVTVDSSMETFSEQELRPVNGLRSAPFKFVIKGKSDSVVDLSRTLLDVKLKIVDAAGDGIPVDPANTRTEEITLAGNPISSLWKRIETRLNDKIINIESSRNIVHKGIIEDWLTNRLDHRTGPQGLRQKKKIDWNPHQNFYENERGRFNDGKIVQFVGTPPVDFLKVNNFLAPRTALTLTFYPEYDDFLLLNAEKEGYRIVITNLVLHIRRVQIAPEMLPRVPQQDQARKEIYCGKFGVVKEYQIPKGALRWVQNVILDRGRLPKFVLLGLVAADALSAVPKKKRDPCYFDNFGLNYLQLRAGEKYVPCKAYTPRRLDRIVGGMREYYSLFDQLGLLHQFVSPHQHAEGSLLYPFNLTPDLSSFQSPKLLKPQTGPMTVNIGFESSLTETVVLILYMVYHQTVSITGSSGFPVEEQF